MSGDPSESASAELGRVATQAGSPTLSVIFFYFHGSDSSTSMEAGGSSWKWHGSWWKRRGSAMEARGSCMEVAVTSMEEVNQLPWKPVEPAVQLPWKF